VLRTYSDCLDVVLVHPWSADIWSLVTSYDVKSRITTHLLGYTPGTDLKNITTTLKSGINFAHHPLLVPMCAYAASVAVMVSVDELTRSSLMEINLAIGLDDSPPVGVDEGVVRQLKGNLPKLNEVLVSAQSRVSGASGWRVFFPQMSKALRKAMCTYEAVTKEPQDVDLVGDENVKDRLDMLDQEREYREALLEGYDSQIRLFMSMVSLLNHV
jgi:hypothetical protein